MPEKKPERKKEKKKYQKEMWNWDWKKAKIVGKDGKETAVEDEHDEHVEVAEAGEVESKYQYPLICVRS